MLAQSRISIIPGNGIILLLLLLGAYFVCATALGQEAPALDLRIASVTKLNTLGGRVDWQKTGAQLIAYDKRSPYNYYNLFLMTTNGNDVASLTAGNPLLPGKHAGNPAWHPTGQLLVIEAERQSYSPDEDATPGLGYGNDLWFITADGSKAWRMDTVTVGGYPQPAGVLHPHFSTAGSLLDWAEYTGTNNVWLLKLADFALSNGVPVVSNVRSYNPGNRQSYFETHTFSPDDSRFLYMSDEDPYLNIYSFDIATATSTRLSSGSTNWNEHAHYSPDGSTILWMSSNGLVPTNTTYPTEYWAMNADTSAQRQLSWFNTPGQQQFQGLTPVVSGDEDWNDSGSQFVGYLQVGLGLTNESDYDVLITFVPSNSPVAKLPSSAQLIYTAPVPTETNAAGYEPVEVYAMDTAGQTITRLTFSQFAHINAAVSPDWSKIVSAVVLQDSNGNGVLDPGDVKQLWLFDPIHGTQQPIVTNYDAGIGGVAWSADSQNIYCAMTQGYTNYDIYRISPDGSSVLPVTTNLLAELGLPGNRKWISDVNVSPDGEWLAFRFAPALGATNFVAKMQIGICHLDGKQAQLVTDGSSLSPGQLGSQTVGDYAPAISPDDQTVVFQRVTTNGFVGTYPINEIYSAGISSGVLTLISSTNHPVVASFPDWSLDQRIVYSEANPALALVGPVLAATNGATVSVLGAGLNGSSFKWIAPAWPQTTLAVESTLPGHGELSWFAATNFNFQIVTTTNLDSSWQSSGPVIYGSNETVIQPLAFASASSRFYRVNVNLNAQTLTP